MIELLIILPNLIASLYLMLGKPFQSNLIYSVGYILLIWHNIQIQDSSQMVYFSILEVMALGGVGIYVYKRKTLLKISDNI